MKVKLAVGTIFFDSKDELERLIQSVYDNVDYIFLIDGRLKHWPDTTHELSNDGSKEMISKYKNCILVEAPNLLEHQKRQYYLDLCAVYNITHLIIMDSDEYVAPAPESNWNNFKVELAQNRKDYIYKLKVWAVVPNIFDNTNLVPVDAPRLWLHPCEMEYKRGRHYQFGLKGKDNPEPLTATKTLYGIKLIHDPHLRPLDYMEKYHKFCEWRVEYEKFMQIKESNEDKAYRNTCVYAGN